MNAVGGPVGGAAGMNNGGQRNVENNPQTLLNTYIYDYFIKNGAYDLAKMILNGKQLEVYTESDTKPSPNNRVNGVDDSMDTDNKEDVHKRPDDLPKPRIGSDTPDNSFLLDWWCQFWDIFMAQHNKITNKSTPAQQYLFHTRQHQQRMMMSGQLGNFNPMAQRMQNGMVQKAMQNNQNVVNNAQLQAMRQVKMMMPRDGSGMDINQRPQSPSSAENAPSPSKRQRIEGSQFNGQGVGPGRSQAMQGPQMGATSTAQGNQMMLPNGMNSNEIPPNQFGAFQSQNPNIQGKALEGLNAGAVAQGSPMAQQNMDAGHDMFATNAAARIGGGHGQPQGNHALQDYQMQLMLLEQQNKKRLLMARQEQDNMTQAPHAPGAVGQPGFAQAMSPQGSRAGPSPNPSEQIKRGTPKMGQTGLPGSPMPDGAMQQNRGSPIPNFDPGQIPPGIPGPYYNQMGANMRPPSSHPHPNMQMTQQQMEALRRTNQMPNGVWPQGPPQMMPNQNQQPGQMGTPQRTNMPPPPAPAAGTEAQRTQPSSPAQPSAPAPPTPSQSSKPNPKKKDSKENKKKPAKKGTTGATPAAETQAEAPTPTPSTPMTPMHPSSFHQKPGQPNANAPNQEQAQTGAAPQVPSAQVDTTGAPFGDLNNPDGSQFNLDFSIDGPDVLESFDFESFLQTDDNNSFGMDSGFSFADGVEAGIGNP